MGKKATVVTLASSGFSLIILIWSTQLHWYSKSLAFLQYVRLSLTHIDTGPVGFGAPSNPHHVHSAIQFASMIRGRDSLLNVVQMICAALTTFASSICEALSAINILSLIFLVYVFLCSLAHLIAGFLLINFWWGGLEKGRFKKKYLRYAQTIYYATAFIGFVFWCLYIVMVLRLDAVLGESIFHFVTSPIFGGNAGLIISFVALILMLVPGITSNFNVVSNDKCVHDSEDPWDENSSGEESFVEDNGDWYGGNGVKGMPMPFAHPSGRVGDYYVGNARKCEQGVGIGYGLKGGVREAYPPPTFVQGYGERMGEGRSPRRGGWEERSPRREWEEREKVLPAPKVVTHVRY